ncbi:helix-turn-helix domain-containing protein [Actinoallomurus soli]|uniref:hypothetical protein n=1 Tax=Actinoallomurus soli TaxID=2952535 RepID=UPI002092D40B|nr:hypothetical protein [Actinoallomurus soli]MCO5969914.1 hypothetical protein [Actinoallomurus soli]
MKTPARPKCGSVVSWWTPGARRCFVAGREFALRAREFDLLSRLAADAGKAVSRRI